MAEPGVKELFATIKKSPALMITAVVFIGIVLYLLIKKGPGGVKATTDTNSGLNTGSGSYIQPFIEPIVIGTNGVEHGIAPTPVGGVPQTPMTVSPGDGSSPSPTTGITMPPAWGGSPGGSGSTTNSSANSPGAFFGLLGPNAAINTQNKTYTNSQGQQSPLPIPPGAKVVQGSQGRVWYVYNNQQYLLTSGTGPPSANVIYTPGSQFQPASNSQSGVTQVNSQQQNVTNTPSTIGAHS